MYALTLTMLIAGIVSTLATFVCAVIICLRPSRVASILGLAAVAYAVPFTTLVLPASPGARLFLVAVFTTQAWVYVTTLRDRPEPAGGSTNEPMPHTSRP